MPRLDAVIDISHHQPGPINFAQLRADGIVGVVHKATQGAHFRDPDYAARRTAAEKAGLLWGAYHFAENAADSGSGAAQAKVFLDTVGNADAVFVALDYESYHHKNTPEVQLNMAIGDAEDFIDVVAQRLGRRPFFYSGSTIREVLGAKVNANLGACKLWVAGYIAESRLKIQRSWDHWTFWQYTDGRPHNHPNPVPHFGPCDREVFDGTEQDLRAVWAS